MIRVKPIAEQPDVLGLEKDVPPDKTEPPTGGLRVAAPTCVIKILKSQGAGAQARPQDNGVIPGANVTDDPDEHTFTQVGSAAYQSTTNVQPVLFFTL